MNFLKSWGFIRILRLAFAGFAIVQAIITMNVILGLLGLVVGAWHFLMLGVVAPAVAKLITKLIVQKKKLLTLSMKKWLQSNIGILIGTIIGAIVGYIYYKQIGCSSGTCAITSNPYNSIMYFSLIGGLLMSFLKPKPKKEM